MSSKTARSSAVKEVAKPKVEIPQDELIRLLRIDLDSNLWPSSQKAEAALKAYDTAAASLNVAIDRVEELNRQLVLAQSTIETLNKTIADMATVVGVESELFDVNVQSVLAAKENV